MALGGWGWGLQLSPRSKGPSAMGIPGAHSFLPTYAHCHPFSSIAKLRIRPYHMNVRETQGNPSSFQSIEPTFKVSDCDRIFALQKLFPTASVSSVNIKSELWKANMVHLKALQLDSDPPQLSALSTSDIERNARPSPREERKEDCEFKANLGYIVTLCQIKRGFNNTQDKSKIIPQLVLKKTQLFFC